jgi:S-adenosylmethionine-dependent methyltransferase
MSNVEKYYDDTSDGEWIRLMRHRLEFEITKKALDEHIAPGSRVLDVGGGPGRYSIHLASRGCAVTLIDLSGENVRRAQSEACSAGVALEACIQGDALELDQLLPGQAYDAVLCMGPLYHLLEERQRVSVVEQCLSHLKPGGIFAASFISAYAPILNDMRNCPQTIAGNAEKYIGYLSDGRNFFENNAFTDAYFIHPLTIETFMANFPLEKISILAAEGLGVLIEPALVALSEEQFMSWVDLFYRIAGNIELFGACEHLLYIGIKTYKNI